MHLDIQVGEHANNYPEIAAKDKLTELQLRARQLLDQVEQIQKEQNYQRVRAHRCTQTWQVTFKATTPHLLLAAVPVWVISCSENGMEFIRLDSCF